jgi:hypothetical protein
MGLNIAQKLIQSHLVTGSMVPGTEIGIRIDQTLTQDATGTMVMLELEAMAIERVKTALSVQYVDHNLIQADYKNPDDHLFLRSAAQRFGLWFSRPGNGVSHPIHQERFGKSGATSLTPPERLGLPFASWTLERLEAYVNEQQDIAIKRSRIDELLLAAGLRWRMHETGCGKRVDAEFAKKRGVLKHSTRAHLQVVS